MIHSNKQALHDIVIDSDMVVGGVLVAGSSTPKLVTRDMLRNMRDGSVLVDVSIDQGVF